ncbi:MAG: lectin-like protein [Phycisphaerae bacterium]
MRTTLILLIVAAVMGCLLAGCNGGTDRPGDSTTQPSRTADVSKDQPSDPEPTRPSNVPDDAVAFGGHWYKVYETGDADWKAAKKACEKRGGYLACIESEKEQQFIADLADGRYLSLGGTDEDEEGRWVWINGSKWDYTAWMPGQPNNYGGDENYLATYDNGDWVDVADTGGGFWMPTGYICEWEK